MQRRSFLKAGLGCVGLGGAAFRHVQAHDDEPRAPGEPDRVPIQKRICLFTDHLDDFDYGFDEVAKMLRELGVAGPDLTVRPGGLVAPERVADDLPKAVAAFREQGLSVPMISTGLTSAEDPAARPTLTTMARLGIGYYKLGYYAYEDPGGWQARLAVVRREVDGLAQLGRPLGVRAGFHNHAGPFVGGALWDSWNVLQPMDSRAVGFYFDPAQATIEGGKHAWKLNFQRIAPRLVMVAIKDFVWEEVDGRWQTRWCPLGEGMVDWTAFFGLLAAVPFDGPVSLHIEYDPGGANRAARFENSLAAADRDLKFLRQHLDAALAPAQSAPNGDRHR
ncbi:MAG TPA: sugar phosphate isomerase/epimerase family protein [Planctomycetaceae bacterium]|nr:sugar phosphate isomerase/epimerase family protein [Planctomycetaceae bacterium]